MSSVHIYVAKSQPATRYFVPGVGDKKHWVTNNPRAMVYVGCCLRWRWASRCTVQVYYDSIRFWCKKGHGCKA